MFSRLRQLGAGVWTRVLVTALALVLVSVCFPVDVCAREDPPKPYIQPGDGDGPAGVRDAELIKNYSDDVLPLWFVGGCPMVELIVIKVVILKAIMMLEIVPMKP